MDSILDAFFNKELDKEINGRIPEYSFERYKERVMNYVDRLLAIDIVDYLEWLDNQFSAVSLSVEDAVQYSKLSDAIDKAIAKMILNGDKGFTHIEIGKMIQDDGKDRKNGAYLKYGENHIKVARYLGYAFSMNRYYYVSLYGYASLLLDEKRKEQLYNRLFVRTSLFRMVYMLKKADIIKMRTLFDFLSDSTFLRRRGNVRHLFEELTKTNEVFEPLMEKLDFEL